MSFLTARLLPAFCLMGCGTFAQSLSDALSLPAGVSLATGGSRSWQVDATSSVDGLAARSGGISHNQASWLEISAEGPGTLRFWTRVSTEPEFDYFRIYLNGVEQAHLASSGEMSWVQRSVFLPGGASKVRFEFRKDEADDETGDDAVWMDQVTLVPADEGPPVVAVQPSRTGVEAGAELSLEVSAHGQPPLHYQWRKGGTPISGATASVLVLTGFNAGLSGSYDCVVTNLLGTVTTSAAQVSLVSHGASLDHTERAWYAGGDTFWTQQSQQSVAGGSSLRSGALADGQRSEFRASFTGPGTVRYWRRLSTEEGFDFLRVRVDGVPAHQASGLRGWESASLVVPAGVSIIAWSYEKNERFTFGDDAVWIDQVQFLPGRQGWLQGAFSAAQLADPAVSGWPADPDGDGLANALEYVLGGDPLNPPAIPPDWLEGRIGPLEGEGTGPDRFGLIVSLPLNMPEDAVLVIEHSSGLQGGWTALAQKTGNAAWVAVNGGLVVESGAVNGRMVSGIFHPEPVGTTSLSGFLRLRVDLLGS